MAQQLVSRVTSVDYSVLKTRPPILQVMTKGIVPTSGWSNPGLSPYVYISPPKDGVLDMDFVAEPPTGVVLPVETGIEASIQVPDFENFWGENKPLAGVRIHARANSDEIMLGANPKAFSEETLIFVPILR